MAATCKQGDGAEGEQLAPFHTPELQDGGEEALQGL